MIVHQVFAQIFEGEVKNVIVYEDCEKANYVSRATYGAEAFAVDCLQYPCSIGDKYRDNKFYRVDENGEESEIQYIPTIEQQLTATQIALVDQYEQNLALQEEITNTQMAIAELYEAKEVV